jgi:hypothetical protein
MPDVALSSASECAELTMRRWAPRLAMAVHHTGRSIYCLAHAEVRIGSREDA